MHDGTPIPTGRLFLGGLVMSGVASLDAGAGPSWLPGSYSELRRGPRRKAAGACRSRLWARFLPDLGRPGSLGRPPFLREVTDGA